MKGKVLIVDDVVSAGRVNSNRQRGGDSWVGTNLDFGVGWWHAL